MRTIILLLTILLLSNSSKSQPISLTECESIFIKNNLQILAEQYNIDAAKAHKIQAGLWENPFVSAELNAYNPNNKNYFDIGANGQKAFAIEQLIHIGGQKRNEVAIAKTNIRIAELKFEDLLRTLRYTLRQSYYAIYYDNISLGSINLQLKNLQTLIDAYQIQADKGNIAPKDVLRLQSLCVNLKNDKIVIVNDIQENERKLKILLSTEKFIEPKPTSAEELKYWEVKPIVIDTLIQVAKRNRKDLEVINTTIEENNLNLRLQKSLAVPDINIGVSHDQAAGAFPNQTSLTLGIPLPLWNRNQGNIKAAKTYTEQSKANYLLAEQQVTNEVIAAYEKYKNTIENYQQIDKNISLKYDSIYQSIFQNFLKSNISIIEFTDFMESYNQSIIQLNEMKKSIINASEEINFSTASTIF